MHNSEINEHFLNPRKEPKPIKLATDPKYETITEHGMYPITVDNLYVTRGGKSFFQRHKTKIVLMIGAIVIAVPGVAVSYEQYTDHATNSAIEQEVDLPNAVFGDYDLETHKNGEVSYVDSEGNHVGSVNGISAEEAASRYR